MGSPSGFVFHSYTGIFFTAKTLSETLASLRHCGEKSLGTSLAKALNSPSASTNISFPLQGVGANLFVSKCFSWIRSRRTER